MDVWRDLRHFPMIDLVYTSLSPEIASPKSGDGVNQREYPRLELMGSDPLFTTLPNRSHDDLELEQNFTAQAGQAMNGSTASTINISDIDKTSVMSDLAEKSGIRTKDPPNCALNSNRFFQRL